MIETHTDKAVIYCRVSSQKQMREGDGLESQRARCEEFAKYRGLQVVEIFKDDASGSLVNRPAMKAMIAFLKSRKQPHIVIIDDISRLARGLEAHLTLRDKIRKAGGILQSPTIDFSDDDSDSSLMEHVLASVSQHARQKIRETTRNRMRGRMMNGYWSFRAPIGFKFQRVAGHGNLLVRDEPVASLIQEIFEGYASGRFSGPAEIMRYLVAHPVWPRSRSETMTVERVMELLERVHYAGYLNYPDWGIHMLPAKHEPIISLAVFNAVQDRLNGNAKVMARKDINEDFPLRGFVECDDCGHTLTSCWAKGRNERYPYYHCQTKGCRSYGKSIKRDLLEGSFRDILNTITPSVELFDLATAVFQDLWAAQEASSKNAQAHLVSEALRLERQIEQLVDRIVNAESETLVNAYENRLRTLEANKMEMKEKIANCGRPLADFDTTYRTAMEHLANPIKRWDFGDLSAKRAVLKLTFETRLRYNRETGFRTAETSIPFNIFNGLGDLESEDLEMVPRRGLEPPRGDPRQHLKLVRLPIPPSGHGVGGAL